MHCGPASSLVGCRAAAGARVGSPVSVVHAIVLGIVQGLTEFLPISSSGHLQLVPWLLGWDDFAGRPQVEQAFDVALHLGTLVALLGYFREDLTRLVRAGLRVGAGADPDRRTAWLLAGSAIPAAVVGGLFDDVFARAGEREWLIAGLLVTFGLVLAWADRRGGTRPVEGWRPRDAAAMGLAQAAALVPGVSRSGITMTAGRGLGYSRDAAARLSFLMSVPVTAGALAWSGLKLVSDGVPADMDTAIVWGVAASAVSGWVAVWGILRVLRTRTFTPFVVYRVGAGALVLGLVAGGFRSG